VGLFGDAIEDVDFAAAGHGEGTQALHILQMEKEGERGSLVSLVR